MGGEANKMLEIDYDLLVKYQRVKRPARLVTWDQVSIRCKQVSVSSLDASHQYPSIPCKTSPQTQSSLLEHGSRFCATLPGAMEQHLTWSMKWVRSPCAPANWFFWRLKHIFLLFPGKKLCPFWFLAIFSRFQIQFLHPDPTPPLFRNSSSIGQEPWRAAFLQAASWCGHCWPYVVRNQSALIREIPQTIYPDGFSIVGHW